MASTGGRDTPKSWMLSGKHMMMGPACVSDRAVRVATHGFLLLIYNFWVFYGVRPFSIMWQRDCDDRSRRCSRQRVTKAVHSVNGKKCVYVHSMVSLVPFQCGTCHVSFASAERSFDHHPSCLRLMLSRCLNVQRCPSIATGVSGSCGGVL